MTTFIVIVEDEAGFDAMEIADAMRAQAERGGMSRSALGVSCMQMEQGFSISDLSPLPVVDAA